MDNDLARKSGRGGRPSRHDAEVRAQVVLDVAKGKFLSAGYRETSLDAISRDAGVAKKTLYCHFGSKAGLFDAIVRTLADAWVEELRKIVANDNGPVAVLEAAALHLLDVGTRSDMIELYRTLIVESRRSPALVDAYRDRCGNLAGTEPLTNYLRRAVERGEFTIENVDLAVEQFVYLVLGGVRARMLLGCAVRPNAATRRRIARQAVRIFVSGCAK
ncbi:TetR/AcrR family transcriptional regulator [Paraburkholderia ginsengiterrae]|uniref:TetR family transcriptional regulator n=1 Tax=Paraburkholderia ginsengiterrae TaxID=1462993 RepID=A0A1A9N8C0_9BURK|nr:TetR/AcrR family transcriptional regulator [Paraburkholderia ginsengiterrae]OAJ60153.1 TetR family transcriptional regulator [Paraburkholderia ginsengiterrae]